MIVFMPNLKQAPQEEQRLNNNSIKLVDVTEYLLREWIMADRLATHNASLSQLPPSTIAEVQISKIGRASCRERVF